MQEDAQRMREEAKYRGIQAWLSILSMPGQAAFPGAFTFRLLQLPDVVATRLLLPSSG